MLELEDIKKMHDKAYETNQTARIEGADDLAFFVINQWDDYIGEVQLQYRGEFDILMKAVRQIEADLRANPVQPDFRPLNENRKDAAELLDGLYRADDHRITSQEAYDRATTDMLICGMSAWELYTEYETNRIGDENQVLRRRFIPQANNAVFFDPNSKCLDRSDANFVSVLTSYTEDGYKDLYEDLTGEEAEEVGSSFAYPEESYTFPWIGHEQEIYVTSFYHREKVTDKVLMFMSPLEEPAYYLESELEDKEILDDMAANGFTLQGEREIERWQVTKYIASGREIIAHYPIAGPNIPVVPVYGEFYDIESEQYWRGIVRKAKDPQRARNFHFSYMMDIVARSPRQKPIFFPEQIQGFEDMYDEAGSENNYPYLLANRLDAPDGSELPPMPAGLMPEQPIPAALTAMVPLMEKAVDDVASPGLPQDLADPDLSGKAIYALQSRLDNQSYKYQDHVKIAKRRDAEIYAGMAAVVYDAPRTVTVESEAGTTRQVQVMELIMDSESGRPVVINDLTNMEFDVFAEIGPAYTTQKQQSRDELVQLMQTVPPDNPVYELLLLQYLEMTDGTATDALRKYARMQLVLRGYVEPETDEEIAAVQQQSEQAQEPDAATLLAMAEMQKAQAAQMREQRQAIKDQADVERDQGKLVIDQFKAETDRLNMQVDAQEAGANINYTNIKAFGEQLENVAKARNPFRAQLRGSG